MKKRIAVIGGGLGGLSAGIRLAHNGFDVDLFEQNNHLGGKVSEIRSHGYRFDTGPSVITLINYIRDLFVDSGESIDDYMEFVKIEPISRNFFSDGTLFDLSSDINRLNENIRKFTGNSNYISNKYIAYLENIYGLTADVFLNQPLHEILMLIRQKKFPPLTDFLRIDAFRTMHQANHSFFNDTRLQKVFDRFATYNGSSPYLTPATLNIIAYVELILGSYYIKGGIYRLVESIFKLAQKVGVNLYFNKKADEIIHDNNKVIGIKVNGENHRYDYVVSNADVVYTHKNLIKGFPRITKKIESLEPSLSGLVYLLGVNKIHHQLMHHNVFFADDYENEFVEIFKKQVPPIDPTIYLAITSKSDEQHAPVSSENWFLLINMPYINKNLNEERIELMMNVVLNKLKNFGFDISNNIEFVHTITPFDLESSYSSNKGSIYGISSNSRFTAFKRHPNRSRILKNLFFAGGSVHPGGGVPLVLSSGKLVSDLILNHDNF